MLKKILLTMILTGFIFVLAGCRTFEGLGEDVEWTGEKIQEAAGGNQ
jgi:predicted small secreted protein